jgi:arabinogalactan oligomer / maltooligosaccharide transport system permease protein
MGAATSSAQVEVPQGASTSIMGILLRYLGIAIVVAIASLLVIALASDGVWELAIFIALVTAFVVIVNLRENLAPVRWMSPALALMALMIIYPIIYTVYVSITNYGDGNFFPKGEIISQLLETKYVAEDGIEYADYTVYRGEAGDYALWLVDDADKTFFAEVGKPIAEAPAGEPPDTYNGYAILPNRDRFRALQDLENVTFGSAEQPVGIQNRQAVIATPRYSYDAASDTITDKSTGSVYTANDTIGFFIDQPAYEAALKDNPSANLRNFALSNERYPSGAGYRVLVGLDNFTRFLTSPALRGPLLLIFTWTIAFALLSVITTFTLGLLIALLLQSDTPGKRIFRTLLIVPYAIPSLISVATWKGMLNENFGVFARLAESLTGQSVTLPFFADPVWSKVGILTINLWLGYPYFMLVCSGALAAIPSDMYEAARVDGATAWQQFRALTLPMLLVSVGPLLIASFTYNFNNFVLIEVYNKGGPPIFGTPTPAGHTDILISYAYRLAFGTGRGADYGLASAVTIIIFVLVAGVTLLQSRFTRSWEETSRNV